MKKAIFSLVAMGFVLLATVEGSTLSAADVKPEAPPIQPPLTTES